LALRTAKCLMLFVGNLILGDGRRDCVDIGRCGQHYGGEPARLDGVAVETFG